MSETTQVPEAHIADAVTQRQTLGLISASLTQACVELVALSRGWQSMLSNVVLPVMMMSASGAVFNQKVPSTDVDYRLLFISGIIAVGAMSIVLQSLTTGITLDREEDLIRRLAAPPIPRGAYFIGATTKAPVTIMLEVIILMVLGMVLYYLSMPFGATRWFTLVWVILLGVSSCSLASIVHTALALNVRTAIGVTIPSLLISQIISGAFFLLSMIPAVLVYIGHALPPLWTAKGLRFVFLPESLVSTEPGGTWDLGMVAIVLGVQTIIGVISTTIIFKWRGQRVK